MSVLLTWRFCIKECPHCLVNHLNCCCIWEAKVKGRGQLSSLLASRFLPTVSDVFFFYPPQLSSNSNQAVFMTIFPSVQCIPFHYNVTVGDTCVSQTDPQTKKEPCTDLTCSARCSILVTIEKESISQISFHYFCNLWPNLCSLKFSFPLVTPVHSSDIILAYLFINDFTALLELGWVLLMQTEHLLLLHIKRVPRWGFNYEPDLGCAMCLSQW